MATAVISYEQNRYRFTVLLFLCFLSIVPFSRAFGQSNVPRFSRLSTEDGLSQTTITSIAQDTTGFMWFGTWDGLNRYDGYTFTVFRPSPHDSTSISNNSIRTIFVDSRGRLWVGTDHGLNLYHPDKEIFTRIFHKPAEPGSLSSDVVRCIFEDSKKRIWFGTRGGGINLLENDSLHFSSFVNPKKGSTIPLENFVFCLETDKSTDGDYLLAGTEGGLFRLNVSTGKYSQVILPSLPITSAVMAIAYESDSVLWIATWDQGLIRWNQKKNICRQFLFNPSDPGSLPSNLVTTLVFTPNRELWIGTRGGGLGIWQPVQNKFQRLINAPGNINSLSDNSITSAFVGNDGTIWIGTQIGGINKYNIRQRHFKLYRNDPGNPNSLSSNIVTSIFQDSKGNLWIGTRESGLNRLNHQSSSFFRIKTLSSGSEGLSSNAITSFWQDPASPEILWIGTDGGGLNRMDLTTGKFKVFRRESNNPFSLSNNYVYSITGDKFGRIWIGTWGVPGRGGLDLFIPSSGRFINFPHRDKDSSTISSNAVMKVLCDSKNILWIGTKGGGLNKIKLYPPEQLRKTPGILRIYTHDETNPHSLSNNDVYAIYEDAEGVIWIGTGEGLNRYDQENDEFVRFTLQNGLPSNVVYGILDDRQGNLWVSTANGIARIDKTGDIRVYDKNDGLQENTFYPGAYFKSSSGELYFGGTGGLTYFHPDSITAVQQYPRVIITSVQVFNRKGVRQPEKFLSGKKGVSRYREITLSPSDFMITIEFAALEYVSPNKITYQYQLKGLSDEWIQTSASNRRATFTNLKPGDYQLSIALSGASETEEHGASLIIHVLPPFYNTWIFKLIIILVLIGLVAWLFINRISALRREKAQIAKKAEEDLFEERNQLRTLIDNMPDLIFIKDRESRFIVANKKLARIMGNRTPEELVGKTDFIYYPSRLANKFYQDEQQLMLTGTPIINQIEPGLDEEGKPAWISVTKVPLKNSKGEIVGLVGIGRDITQQKLSEEKLIAQAHHLQEVNVLLEERQEEVRQQAEELQAQADHLTQVNKELEKLNATKDKLFSLIAHDLKNPFHAISGFATMLSRNFSQMKEREKLEIIDMMNLSAETAYNLLENLLQWARAQTNRIRFEPERLNLDEVIRETFEFLATSAQKKRIELLTENTEVFVIADKNMLSTILRNLISNAIKFTPEKGKVTVSACEEDGKIEVSVIDNGIGMTEQVKSKLFQLEELHTSPGTSGETGTGLGLIVCREFVERQGGTIRVESEPMKGSRFIFTLPKADM
ncbi:MAG: PAS domain-containing protein [Bacteroidales bacterium]|nr:PAS domain-containing protein [Bacteroidales bacterium]